MPPKKKITKSSGSKSTKKSSNRKSPSASATAFRVGTKKIGNDGREWKVALTTKKIKRWILYKSTRKGPTESATKFKLGTIKKGNDGQSWKIVASSTGVKRWVKMTSPIDSSIVKINDENIVSFDFDKLRTKLKKKRIIKLGSLNITSNTIGVGELLFNKYPAKKGLYHIYQYEHSLIAVHENSSINGQQFKLTKYTANCDIGMFAYNDYKRISKYVKLYKKQWFGVGSIHFDTSIVIGKTPNQIGTKDAYRIYESDIENNTNKNNNRDPVMIIAGNGAGDGSYTIYKGSNAYFIMADQTQEQILKLLGIE